jgi:hypothetical protein
MNGFTHQVAHAIKTRLLPAPVVGWPDQTTRSAQLLGWRFRLYSCYLCYIQSCLASMMNSGSTIDGLDCRQIVMCSSSGSGRLLTRDDGHMIQWFSSTTATCPLTRISSEDARIVLLENMTEASGLANGVCTSTTRTLNSQRKNNTRMYRSRMVVLTLYNSLWYGSSVCFCAWNFRKLQRHDNFYCWLSLLSLLEVVCSL